MKGSCSCGQITYTITQLDSAIVHCSCHSCRKAHAAPFATVARVKDTNFNWLSGTEYLKHFESSPGKKRFFCSECGSQLLAKRDQEDHVILRVATLDEDPGQKPEVHIFKSHEVDWLRYGPSTPGYDMPGYDEWQPGR